MDDLLKSDTEAMHWELNKQESIRLLETLFPDKYLGISRSVACIVTPQICHLSYHPVLGPPKAVGCQLRKRTQDLSLQPKRWLVKSKCPDLSPEATPKQEHPLLCVFNAVLQSVKAACGLEYLKWNANSSTTLLKGYGLDYKRKPDIALFECNSDSWPHLISFYEVKNKADTSTEKESYIELADGRHIAPSICILSSKIYFTLFNRGGSISTCGFDIHDNPETFL
ncbi:hypothetical protein V8E55_011856 [Tylopilus felleus]